MECIAEIENFHNVHCNFNFLEIFLLSLSIKQMDHNLCVHVGI